MTIAYVQELATSNNNGTTASFSITLAAAPSAGNTVMFMLRVCPNASSGYSATFSDSKGNTWSTDYELKDNFQYVLIGTTRQDVGTLTTSDTVTFTMNMARSSNTPTLAWVEEFSGLATSSYTDSSSGTASGSGTTLATATLTPTQDGDLVVAFIDTEDTSVTETINASGTVGTYSSFTTAHLNSSGVGNSRVAYPVYQILSTGSGTGQAHAWSLSASTWSDRLNGLYKVAPSATPDTRAFMAFMP